MYNGVILVDKPRGMTSFDVVRGIKNALMSKGGGKACRVRIGHAGTLDPMATGLLPICIGHATKLTQFIVVGLKEYVGEMILGKRTDTFDCEGRVLEEHPVDRVDKEALEAAVSGFTGCLLQSPPPFSAAKYKGRPLYHFARKGITVKKEPKEVFVKEFEILEIKGRVRVGFRVVCSKGTYVRGLVNDIGDVMGVGAYLDVLRRTRVGPFGVEQAFPLDIILNYLEQDRLSEIVLDFEAVLQHIPSVEIDTFLAKDVIQGVPLSVEMLMELMINQGVEYDPLVPYIRLRLGNGALARGERGQLGEREAERGRRVMHDSRMRGTVAVCFWPPQGVHEKNIKMAKVFHR